MSPVVAEVVTREILWNVPPWARGLMYLLFFAASMVCVLGIARRVRVWRRGRESGTAVSVGKACGRLWLDAILQARIWRSGAAGLLLLS